MCTLMSNILHRFFSMVRCKHVSKNILFWSLEKQTEKSQLNLDLMHLPHSTVMKNIVQVAPISRSRFSSVGRVSGSQIFWEHEFESRQPHLCNSMWGQDRLRASHQEVSVCTTRGGSQGIYITFASTKSEWGGTHSGFKTQRRHHQKSKTGVPVALKKGHVCPPKSFFFFLNSTYIFVQFDFHIVYTRRIKISKPRNLHITPFSWNIPENSLTNDSILYQVIYQCTSITMNIKVEKF